MPPEKMPVEKWHESVLAEREAMYQRGEDRFEDWEAAKERIKKQVTCL